jgi:Mg2+ and Co2+ transporter CorA
MSGTQSEKIAQSAPFYSSHIFIFPFEWNYQNHKLKLFEEQVDPSDLIELMQRSSADWQRSKSWYPPSSKVQFNEANYFYDFVRPVLYDTGDDKSLQAHYQHVLAGKGAKYIIELGDEAKTRYELLIDDIVLSFYFSGVGFLAFHLLNVEQSQSSPDSILKINDFGRRLSPPSYAPNVEWVAEQRFFEDNDWKTGLDITQKGLMARSIKIEGAGLNIVENFGQWQQDPDMEALPSLIQQLLPIPITQKLSISPVLDDRMFVLCWYGNDELVTALKPQGNYLQNDWWYEYLFIDGNGKTCQDEDMMQALLKAHTNARWRNEGTFYGVSRYSLVCLTNQMPATGFAFSKLLSTHLRTMYYKIALLCIMQRACMLRFSKAVTSISQLDKRERNIGEQVSSLYKSYIRFVNRIYFREVSPQEQGIEIYDLLQQHMRLDLHIKELENELRELHNYVMILEENARSDKLDILTYLGAFFVVPSFVVSFFSFTKHDEPWYQGVAFCIGSALLAYGVIISRKPWRWAFLIAFMALMAYLLCIYPNYFPS